MKKITTILFALAVLVSFTNCTSTSTDNLVSNADTRAKVIAELMDNDGYMNEVMVAMKVKHGNAIASTSIDMMKEDKIMRTKMMGHMMDLCRTDSNMCQMMMGRTMDMCDMDESKCNMMFGTMQEHPIIIQSMNDMGICERKGIAMGNMK